GDTAKACCGIATQIRADARLAERVLRDRQRCRAHAAVALQLSQSPALRADRLGAVDDRRERVLDEVAIPARAYVPEVPVAQEARRRAVRAADRPVGAAQG